VRVVVRTRKHLFDIPLRLWAYLHNYAYPSKGESLIPATMQEQGVRLSPRISMQPMQPLRQRDQHMTKEELLQFEGLVVEVLPDARYRVELDNGHALVAYTAGKMKKNRIKTLAGDRVIVEVSPYDLEKGRLVFRHKDERAGSASHRPQRNHFRRR
jgi:translation initiation factor IF-1